ncbi:MAG TPA: Crp/Fnr family transcriptional regulator [Stellaceae bacterium]|nr:Crp/Fnr family transcriptional regulator [Stellaceae bacterium]
MSLKEEVELLRQIPLFAQIEPARLKLLAFTSERLSYEPGQVLCRQGDMGDAAYIVIEGTADVLVNSANGPITVATLGPNDFVGEIAILCDVPRTATVQAVSRLVVLRIAKELFFRLLSEFPSMAVTMLREIAHRLEVTTTQLRGSVAEVQALRLAHPS